MELNLCVCNFVKIVGCDFSYQAPVISHEYIKANLVAENTTCACRNELDPSHSVLKHHKLNEILKEIQDAGKRILMMIHHDTETIKRIFKLFEEHLSHHW